MTYQTTLHRKMLFTLGIGAIALAAVACGSATPTDDPTQGSPPPEPVADGQNGADFALGAPNGIGLTGDSGGTEAAAAPSIGIPPPPGHDCDTGSSDPFTLYIEGEPVSDPPDGKVINDLPDTLGMPVQDPAFYDVPIPAEPPSLLPDAEPAIEDSSEAQLLDLLDEALAARAEGSIMDAPTPIAAPIVECDSATSPPSPATSLDKQ